MTLLGESFCEVLLDRGSIPLASTKKR